jgi:hypothetical protein
MTANLFPRDRVVGIFRGFSQGGMEFRADLVLPYRTEYQRVPMHGQLLLVQLESESEGVLGRITSISAEGRLASGAGEDYGLRAVADDRTVPEDLREQYLKYHVNIRVLGVVRSANGSVVFAASHRRLPHVGSKVAFLSEALLRDLAGHTADGAELGFLALGEFVYCQGDERLEPDSWMVPVSPVVVPRFHARHLVARRSFVFARAGFGKSNLVKLLFSNLYAETPTVTKRGGREVPVGTVLFDPEGEYFWPDDRERPGLADVPGLEERLVVFTNRKGPSTFYDSFVAGGIKLDVRRLRPADVLAIALPPDRQDQQNVLKLKGMNDNDWARLVDEVDREGNGADLELFKKLLRLEGSSEVEAIAARSNLTRVVKMLHDKSSRMLDMLLHALRQGKLCVVDVSQMRGASALVLSGLILQRIFDHNQDQFTAAEPQTIPTIAVLEEAQSVLGNRSATEGPYVSWVKEGRKYDLGAVLITQQPGSISDELLSQGDNWFIFHLLSAGDLQAVRRANAHFSEDLLSSLLNEPIPGHCVFWSSADGRPYPLPLRVMSFEDQNTRGDPSYSRGAVDTFARQLRDQFESELQIIRPPPPAKTGHEESEIVPDDEPPDALETLVGRAIDELQADSGFVTRLREWGVPWRAVKEEILKQLPETLDRRDDIAYQNVPRALDALLGPGHWKSEKRTSKQDPSRVTTWAVAADDSPSEDAPF